jgi:hypothetical protein
MTDLQIDLIFITCIVLLNFIITFLYKKYKSLEQSDERKIILRNESTFLGVAFSIMPRVPFMILNRPKTASTKRLIITHNILCLLVYVMFLTAFIRDII